jgi:hypothetical protein
MDFIALAAFGPIVTGARAALDTRLQGSAVEDRRRRHFLSTPGDSQDGSQIVGDCFKDFGFKPSLCLLVDNIPGRQIVWHQAPGRAAAHHPAKAVEDLPQWIVSLRSVFGH